MLTAFVAHADTSLHDSGWSHPDHQGRLPALTRAVYRDMVALHPVLLEVEAEPATIEDLLLAHAAEYVERVRSGAAAAASAGTPQPFGSDGGMISAASWQAALASVGAGLSGIEVVADGRARNAFCATRPPGGEVYRDRQGDFGLFNHTAIAAVHLRRRLGVERVLVVDWGSRPAVGTETLLAADRGCRVAGVQPALVPPGAVVGNLIRVQSERLDRATSGWTPDWIVLGCGFDLLDSLQLETTTAHPLTVALRERAEALCGGRIVSLLEGGYDADRLGAATVQHLHALAGLPPA